MRFVPLSGRLGLLALLLAACAAKPAATDDPPAAAKPALWKLADADTTIYLFGTIHVLPADYAWENGPIRTALATAQELVLETVIGSDPAALPALLMRMGTSLGLPPLLSRVSADKRPALQDMIARSGIPAEALDRLETWTAALLLVQTSLKDMQLTGGTGVEPQLEARFRDAGRQVEGLETPEQQLGFFDTLPEQAQRDFLSAVAEPPTGAREEYDAMLTAWAKGDAKSIAATFDEELKDSPTLRDALLVRRNANWTKWLEARLDKPGITLVAVGAGHLVGPYSLQMMLVKDGLKVVRLQ